MWIDADSKDEIRNEKRATAFAIAGICFFIAFVIAMVAWKIV